VIAATLWALVSHIQVVPAISKQYDIEPGVVIFAELPPSTRLSLSIVKGSEAPTVKFSAKWRF
jgi:hypothetical protein